MLKRENEVVSNPNYFHLKQKSWRESSPCTHPFPIPSVHMNVSHNFVRHEEIVSWGGVPIKFILDLRYISKLNGSGAFFISGVVILLEFRLRKVTRHPMWTYPL